jgi:hypothetical protein
MTLGRFSQQALGVCIRGVRRETSTMVAVASALGLATVATVAGCSQQQVQVAIQSFDRPARMSFVCTDSTTLGVVPLDRCTRDDEGEMASGVTLYTFITQTSRGELSTVRLSGSRSGIIDTNVTVPGFTFVAVGELPSSVVVPEYRPENTYVSHSGAQSLWRVDTRVFLPNSGETPPVEGKVALEIRDFDSPITDMVIDPDEQVLYLALPKQSTIAKVALLPDGALGEIQQFAVPSEALRDAQVAAEDPVYQKICPASTAIRSATPMASPAVALGDAAWPASMTVDRYSSPARLLVADEQRPVIHVFQLPEMTPLPSLYPGVPVRSLRVTPRVPATLGAGDSETKQYLYAIDATDGSVLAMDYDTGSVLAIDAYDPARPMRLPYVGIVKAIEVVTPQYDGPATPACEPGSERATEVRPNSLQGVFLSLALTDGSIRMVDVYDLDAPCRGGPNCEGGTANPNDVQIWIRRHRPRIGQNARVAASIQGSPIITADGAVVRVANNGVTGLTEVPDLVALQGCPIETTPLFPTQGGFAPLICLPQDTWALSNETWVANFDGLIPGALGGAGTFDVASATFFARGSFCDRSVLGQQNLSAIPEGAPERGLLPDKLQIVSELPSNASAECRALESRNSVGEREPFAFRIVQAYQDRLVLESQSLGSTPRSLEEIVRCYDGPVEYEVHSHLTYVVTSNVGRFSHRVVEGADGSCTVDTNLNPLLQVRAVPGALFQNSRTAFQITAPGATIETAELSYTVAQVPAQLAIVFPRNSGINGVLPSLLMFNRFEPNLYAIESIQNGLVSVDLSRFVVQSSFR